MGGKTIDGVVCEVDDITDGSRHGHVIEAEPWYDEGGSGAAAERFAGTLVPCDRRRNDCPREAPRPARTVRPGSGPARRSSRRTCPHPSSTVIRAQTQEAVRFGFIDLSTPKRREQLCHREVELNRRFSPDVYLGVEDIVDDAGRVVDHAVLMRRMPADRRLATLVASTATSPVPARGARAMAAGHAIGR